MKAADRHEVIIFYITTVLFTWLLWFPALLIRNYGINLALPYNVFIILGTFVPSAAGFFFTHIYGRKEEAYLLFKSLLNVHIGTKWLFIFLVLPGVSGVSFLVFLLLGGTLPEMQISPWHIPFAFAYIFIFMGPLGEEAGWQGFALNRILKSLSPIKAAVLLGMIWSIWHLPLFFINGTTQNILTLFGTIPAISGYFIYTVMISVLITLLYTMSNGSVFGSMVLHTVGNLSLGVVPLIFSVKGAIIIIFTLSITVIAITYKNRKIMFAKIKH